jgi:hypothetical protein
MNDVSTVFFNGFAEAGDASSAAAAASENRNKAIGFIIIFKKCCFVLKRFDTGNPRTCFGNNMTADNDNILIRHIYSLKKDQEMKGRGIRNIL